MENRRNSLAFLSPDSILATAQLHQLSNTPYPKPQELVKTEYQYGQTLILTGKRTDYESLAEFWLSTVFWYGSEGEDSFFKTLVIDDLNAYDAWKDDPHRVGVCKPAAPGMKQRLDQRISFLLGIQADFEYLVMNPEWDQEKVLFVVEGNYCLYYFWTGE